MFFLVLSSALTLASLVFALDVPPLTGRVVDLAQVLPVDVAASLARDLEAHESKTSNQVVVLTLPSLEDEPLETFSHRVATTWKLGQKGTENGVLLLLALRERKVRIEVGYGLEGTLTDLRSAHIIRQEIVPRFRSGDLPGGIAAGVQAILNTIEGTYKAEEVLPGYGRSGQEQTAFEYVIIGIVVGTLAGIVLSHGLQRTRALLGSLLAFLVAQFASVGLGSCRRRCDGPLAVAILIFESRQRPAWRVGRWCCDGPGRGVRRFIWWGWGRIQRRGR